MRSLAGLRQQLVLTVPLGLALCIGAQGEGAVAAPRLEASQASEAAAEGYDVFFALAATGPQQSVLLDWAAEGGLVVTCGAAGTSVDAVTGPERRTLGRGPRARNGELHVRRRVPLIEVSQAGVVLVRTWSRRPLAGQVGPAIGAGLTDFRVQPVTGVDFAYEFSDLEGTGGIWETLSGRWGLGVYRDALFQRDHGDKGPFGASWYETKTPARALAVAGSASWDSYRARVAVLAGETVREGLAFYCHDVRCYALLAVRPAGAAGEGIAELSVVREGVETVLAHRPVTWRTGTWYELSVAAHDEDVTWCVSGAAPARTRVPGLSSGRVGVFADGPGVAEFDDVIVHAEPVVRDDFRRPAPAIGTDPGECWEPTGGRWELRDAHLHATSQAPAQCLRSGAGWPATQVAAAITCRRGSAGICLNWRGQSGYALLIEAGKAVLAAFDQGRKTVLATGETGSVATVPVSLSYSQGLLRGRAGEQELAAVHLGPQTGQCGLMAAGEAGFADFEAREVPPAGAVISTVSGAPQYVPGRGEGERRAVLGYLWRAMKGTWPAVPGGIGGEAGIAPRPAGEQPAELWYYQPCPGDAVVSARGCSLPPGALIGLTLACEADDIASGYALEATCSSPAKLTLLRRGEQVARSDAVAAGAEEATAPEGLALSLWRAGDWVVGTAGSARVAYRDPQPLAGERCATYGRGAVVIGELSLGHRAGRVYSFKQLETDWQPEAGEWQTHSGMACIAWDYWLTGKGTPQAMSYNLLRQPADLQVDLWVSEYTEGFATGEHRHYPYHDVSVVTCAATRERDSGYRFVIGADGGTTTRLLRRGKVVAETRDSRFAIRMHSHCNSPRNIHVVVAQRRGAIGLQLNDVEALRFVDSEPLGAGYVGIGTEGCAVDFRDLWLVPAGGG